MVALSSVGSQRSFFDVKLAVIRRSFQVNQVCVSVRLESFKLWHQHATAALLLLVDFVCTVEFVF